MSEKNSVEGTAEIKLDDYRRIWKFKGYISQGKTNAKKGLLYKLHD